MLTYWVKGLIKNIIGTLSNEERRRQGRRLEKNEFIFYGRISHMPWSVQYVYRSQNLLKLNMQCQRTIGPMQLSRHVTYFS